MTESLAQIREVNVSNGGTGRTLHCDVSCLYRTPKDLSTASRHLRQISLLTLYDPKFVYYCNIYSNYYSVCCLTTGPKPLPKRFLHMVRSKASSFKCEYPLLSLSSSSSFLRLLPRLLVTTISPFILPSITCFRRQFLRKMWPIQLAFRFRISRRIFLCSLTQSNTSSFLT